MDSPEQKSAFAEVDAAFEDWWGEPHSVPQEQKEGFRRAFRQGWCAHIVHDLEAENIGCIPQRKVSDGY